MGIFIFGTVNFNKKITAPAWEKSWQESLHLLEKFPAPLIRIRREETEAHERLVFSRRIRSKKGKPEEHWHVVGDALSKKRAESYLLYRHLNCYETQRGGYQKDKDVLWASQEYMTAINANGYEVFDAKTQGCPFHLAMLAVGMLLETRFPGSACVNGDIELRQAEWMQIWASSQLAEPLELPVCFDAERLWLRLVTAYEGNETLALERFGTLYRGSQEERMEALFHLAGRNSVMQEWSERLASYEDLDRWGVGDLVRQLTNVTGDLRSVIGAVLEVKKSKQKKKFTLRSLLELYCRSLLTLDFPEREALRSLYREEGQLQTIEGVFGQLFSKMGGMPDEVNLYLPPAELLDLFASFEPENRAAFQRIIEEKTAKYRQQLAELAATLEQMTAAPPAKKSKKKPASDKETPVLSTPETLPVRSFSEAEQYILQQTLAQQTHFKDDEKAAQSFARQLHKAIRENAGKKKSIFSIDDVQELRYAIWDASRQSGFALHEDAWAAVDALEDKLALKCLLGLASIDNNELNFWEWRLHLMESPKLWRFFVEQPAQVAASGKKNL